MGIAIRGAKLRKLISMPKLTEAVARILQGPGIGSV